MRILSGYQKPITALAVSPNGARLCSAAAGQSRVWVWDLASGNVVTKLRNPINNSHVGALACSADGCWLLAAGEHFGVTAWALPDGPADALQGGVMDRADHWTIERPDVTIHPNGGRIAFAATRRGGACPHRIQTWDLLARRRKHLVWAFARPVNAVAFSPGGDLLAAASGSTVCFFDADTAKETKRLEQKGDVIRLAFRSDGASLAVACGALVHVWGLATDRPVHELTTHSAYVAAVGYSPDGQYSTSARSERCAGCRALPASPLGGEQLIATCPPAELTGAEQTKAKARGEPLCLGRRREVSSDEA